MHSPPTPSQERQDRLGSGAEDGQLRHPPVLHQDRACPLPQVHLPHLQLQPRPGGDMHNYVEDMEERLRAVAEFKSFQKDILVATDVASKGLDFREIQHLINYNMPDTRISR